MALTGAGKFAAVSAIVIGGDQESGLRIDRFTVEGQVRNTLCLRMDQLALAVVAGRLSDVNLVVHPVNHVEVIGAEAVPVDQRLRLAAGGIDLVKLSGRAFQPLLNLFPADLHHHQGVGVEIEVGGVTEGELTFLHFDKARRIVFTPADFKRCGGGEHRQLRQVRIALNIVFDVGLLRHVDHLHRRVVLHQRQIAVHIVGGLTDRLTDEFASGVVVGFQHRHHLTIFRRQRFLRHRVINRPRFGFTLRHLPFTAVVI